MGAICLTYTLIVLNAIFLLLGVVAFMVAIWISQKDWSYLKLSRAANQQFSDDPMLFTSLLEDANTILMAGSSIAIVIAALGIVAAYKNHRKLLYTYAILLVMSTMLHLGAGVLCCIFRDRFEKFALEYMDISLQTRYRGPFYTTQEFQGDRKFSLAVDYGQATLECCGVLNGSDYTKFTQWNRTWKHHDSNKLQNVSCPVEPTATNSYYYHGCFSHLEGIYKKIIGIFIGAAILVVVMEVAAWLTAFRLARFLQRTFSDFDLW